ncbi:hypothetical protein [Campylobacter concisus]|uniref:hypothetical protein n=1 Tax=Campylobacter concisus TaxID=199 RepID=UPI0015E15DC3|nr:hypothetical protein [Campylobacter concisus]
MNQSVNYQDAFNKQPTTITILGTVKISPNDRDIKHLSRSGNSANDKISIWGTMNGLDSFMGKDKVTSLKKLHYACFWQFWMQIKALLADFCKYF